MSLRTLIVERIRDHGPLTTAEFMDLALYHPTLGYYSHLGSRTGRTGDFFTSVNVGPQFGALLATQLHEMYRLLGAGRVAGFDVVEVGAANGQLARDLLDTAETLFPDMYASIRLTLVETSARGRDLHAETLGHHAERLTDSVATLPDRIFGVILANEFLDALPTHAVAMTNSGLREIYIDLDGECFVERTGPPSSPALRRYLDRLDVSLRPGWRGEVNLAAVDWIQGAARRLTQGFVILVDYGHSASELYSGSHDTGTLTTFGRHLVDTPERDPEQPSGPPWLAHPGKQDITAHVDWTSICFAAETEGLNVLGLPDQSHFLLGLGALNEAPTGSDSNAIKQRLALKTLVVPGGLGSTHHVLLLGKGVGTPTLLGTTFPSRSAALNAVVQPHDRYTRT